ncbi:MAG: glycosyltransferase [Candidatus Gastranaerophilales bacterium]|nr:glycosyltransferase [Candidatus Gastranaerophilales bacterium]
MAEISVIVPVYNVEKYLKECLDSILSQTFADIEIICVNDGSTDNSRKILEEYKNKDSRIIIIDKKNGGLSSARNAGMKIASGEFFSFIDSDDWVDITMLEKLYKNITDLNSDISICAVHQFDETNQKIDDTNPYYTLEYFNESFDGKAFSYKDTKPFIMDVCVMAWNKLYRHSLIEKYSACFPDGLIFEDGPFFFTIFFQTEKVSIVRDFLYYYRINRKNSIIQKAGKKFLNVIDVTEIMFNKIKDLPDFEEIKYTFFRKKVEDFIYRFEHLRTKYKSDFLKKLAKNSSLCVENLFPREMVHGKFRYNYFLFKNLKTGSLLHYELQKLKLKSMYKLMEIMYKEDGVYFFKYKSHTIKCKKRPKIFDIYYYNDKIYISILEKIKYNFNFNFSALEKFNEDD